MTRVFYTNSPPTDIPESTLKIEQWQRLMHYDSVSGQKRLANYLILLTGGHDPTLETFAQYLERRELTKFYIWARSKIKSCN